MFRTHLIHVFFSGQYEKYLFQNFVRARIKLVYRINNTCLAFLTSVTTIYRVQTSELKSISKFQLLFHWKNFEKYMIFYALPWSRWNRTYKRWNTCIVPFAIAELGQMSWSSTHTKKCGLVNRCITVLSDWIMKIFQCYASKQSKNCEKSRWWSLSALVWPNKQSH